MSMRSVEAPPHETADRETASPLERRKRTRMRVHWRVCFWGGPLTEALETVTRDLSSDGFYCLCKVPFVPGERLACSLGAPVFQTDGGALEVELECRVRVIRTEAANGDGSFGMGCRIEEYRVTPHRLRNL
jgi:hypothetical protein